MPIVEETVTTGAVARARVNEEERVTNAIEAIDLIGVGIAMAVAVTGSASAAVTPSQYANLNATASAVAAASHSNVGTMSLNARATATNAVRIGFVESVNNNAVALMAVAPGVTSFLANNAAAVVAGVPMTTMNVTASHGMVASVAATVGSFYSATNTATATNALTLHRSQYENLTNAIMATVDIGGGAQVDMDLTTGATATAALVHRAVTHAVESSAVTAYNSLYYHDPLAVAWVMNTETTAMSRYEGYDFESIAQHNGVVYGVNEDGLYAMTGSDDAGIKINTTIETGFEDMKTNLKKRLPYVYLGYVADGQLKLTVETLDRAVGKATYYTAVLPAYEPVNTRIVLGKGLVGAYFKFTLTNVRGSYFDLDKWAADVAVSTKRRLS